MSSDQRNFAQADTAATEPKGHILVVEDDQDLRELICDFLRLKGHQIVQAANGQEFTAAFTGNTFDLILLDLNLPDADGLQLLQELRRYSQAAIFVVSGRSDEATRLEALDLTVDDYIIKPFNVRELELRIRNFLKRKNALIDHEKWQFGAWLLDAGHCTLQHVDGAAIQLTASEYDLLLLLVRARGQTVTRDQLTAVLDIVPESLNVLISRLRMKLSPDDHMAAPIGTVSGRGYRITAAIEQL